MLRIAITAALIALPSAAFAQAAPDPARTTAATELVRLLDVRGQMRRSMATQMTTLRSGAALQRPLENNPQFKLLRSRNPQLFTQVFARAGALQAGAAERALGDAEADAVRTAVTNYAGAFTVAELRALIAFYTTPTGRALIERLPRIQAATQAALAAKFQPRMEAEMRAVAPQIAAELKRLAPPATPAPAPPAKR